MISHMSHNEKVSLQNEFFDVHLMLISEYMIYHRSHNCTVFLQYVFAHVIPID